MGNVTVQKRHLDVYNQVPCIIKTLRGPFILPFVVTDVNIHNLLILKILKIINKIEKHLKRPSDPLMEKGA